MPLSKQNYPDTVYLPNGDILKLEGKISFEANLAGKLVPLTFYLVHDFAYPFLIGYVTMRTLGADMSFKKDTFTINPDYNVYLHKPMCMPPKSTIITYAKTKKDLPECFKGIFLPLQKYYGNCDKISIIPNLAMAKNNKIPIEITNFSHNFINLHRNSHLGSFQGLTEETQIFGPEDQTAWQEYIKGLIEEAHHTQQPEPTCSAINHTSAGSHSSAKPKTKVAHLIDFSKCVLTAAEKQKLIDLIEEYADIFNRLGNEPTGAHIEPYKIYLKPGTVPHSGSYIRCPPQLRHILAEIIADFLRLGYIEPSRSPWAASCLLIKKPGFKNAEGPLTKSAFRLVTDFSHLKQHVVKSFYPQPKVTEILEKIAGKKYISSVDLTSGFYQIPLHPDSRPITAFMALGKKYQFRRVVQGLTPSSFFMQEAMVKILENSGLSAFMDDIPYAADSFPEYLSKTRTLFQRLREYNLRISPEKFFPCAPELKVLGFIVNQHGIKPCTQKVEVIKAAPVPKTKRQLRAILGLCNYFRRHIPEYSIICQPLYDLTSKNKKFLWGPQQQKAFELLKHRMANACLLTVPDFNKPFVLVTDASKLGIGSFLAQENDRGLSPISFASRKLNKGESSLPATQTELLSIAWSTKVFHQYLLHAQKTILYTDHKPLISLLKKFHDPNVRVQRYLMQIHNYDLIPRYLPGKLNVVSDTLSRFICLGQTQPVTDADLIDSSSVIKQPVVNAMTLRPRLPRNHQDQTSKPAKHSKSSSPAQTADLKVQSKTRDGQHVTTATPAQIENDQSDQPKDDLPDKSLPSTEDRDTDLEINLDNFRKYIQTDSYYSILYRALKYDEFPTDRNTLRKVHRDVHQYILQDDQLYYIYKPSGKVFDRNWTLHLVVPEKLRQQVLYLTHAHPRLSNTHAGIAKTLECLHQNQLYWNGINKSVIQYIDNCKPCCERKNPKTPKAPFVPMDNSEITCLSHVHIDLYSNLKLSKEGYSNLLVCTCRFSKMVILSPLKKATAHAVAQAIVNDWVSILGIPKYIVSDCGKNLTGNIVTYVCKLLGIKRIFTTPLRPQANSQAETKMKHLKRVFSSYLMDHSQWPELVKIAQASYNSTPCSSLSNLSPNEIVFGRKLPTCFSNELQMPDNIPRTVQGYVAELKAKLEEIHSFVQQSLKENQELVIAQKNRDRKLIKYPLGTHVAILSPTIPNKLRKVQTQKLYRPWKVGYQICEIVSDIHYRLICTKTGKIMKRLTHVDRIKRTGPLDQHQPDFTAILDSDSDEEVTENKPVHVTNAIDSYLKSPKQINKFLAKKLIDGEWHIRASFLSFDQSYNEWIPMKHLSSDEQTLAKLMWKRLPCRRNKNSNKQ